MYVYVYSYVNISTYIHSGMCETFWQSRGCPSLCYRVGYPTNPIRYRTYGMSIIRYRTYGMSTIR